jgi:hypothetical protein
MTDTLLACATCASNFADETTNAAGWSIFFLLGMILPVLAGVVFFMIRLVRRSEQALDPEFRDDLPAASSTR